MRGEAWWRGGGLRIWHVGKRGLCNTGQKRNRKKKKKLIFTYMPANEAMAVAGLAGLEGQGMVERWGFEDPACGEKRSLQWSEKKRNEKKKKKNITLLACKCRQWQWQVWGLRKRGTVAWWFACPQMEL